MSRPVRIEFPGAHYYVTSKGLDKQIVFADNEDRAVFLNVIRTVVSRFGCHIHSYVLMNDHYHLVVECPDANLSKGMRQLNGVYTQHFNRRHEKDGPLFQGRFKSILFEPESYLLPLCCHTVSNPVRCGLTTSPQKYRWSSYRAQVGLIKSPAWLETESVWAKFGRREKEQQKKYRAYVRQNSRAASPLESRSFQVLLGSVKFIAAMQPILNGEKVSKRGPKSARRRRTMASLFNNIENKTRDGRNQLIEKAHVDYSYTLKEIGDFLGLHYTTVSKVINR